MSELIQIAKPIETQDIDGLELARLYSKTIKDYYIALANDDDEYIDSSVAMAGYELEREFLSVLIEHGMSYLDSFKTLFTEDVDENWLKFMSDDDMRINAHRCLLHLFTRVYNEQKDEKERTE